MSGIPFYSTVMGSRFFQGEVPRAIRALTDVATAVARIPEVVDLLKRLVELTELSAEKEHSVATYDLLAKAASLHGEVSIRYDNVQSIWIVSASGKSFKGHILFPQLLKCLA